MLRSKIRNQLERSFPNAGVVAERGRIDLVLEHDGLSSAIEFKQYYCFDCARAMSGAGFKSIQRDLLSDYEKLLDFQVLTGCNSYIVLLIVEVDGTPEAVQGFKYAAQFRHGRDALGRLNQGRD